ncbi:hypothetical protein ENSA5_25120 [Enhygromyxa salina]|uniref:DUF459 domain-containing protein n=1 Tax=Enhygromyxa salina TaxID=215803 RepID=A0A2S9YB96_9BACT|nr:DUF459 domain-containing protein [Enhygromyxa salina]PRQ02276.1 hypothetical protein ENSA5_25120 [Enhygromyxa salina]
MSKFVCLNRRSFTLGLGGALAAALLPRGARAGGSKVLVLGGSTIHGALGKNIEAALADAGFTTERHAKSSSGLARPDFYDWPAAAKRYCQRSSPSAVVVMFGGNDGQALFMGEDAKPKWTRWEDAGWVAEYRRRVQAFADAVAPGGEQIFWMGMPEMKSNKLDGRMERMNGIYEAEMAARPNGHYLTTRGLMPGVEGYAEFAKIAGKNVRVRTEDGVHYSLHGARIVAEAIVPKITAALGA